MKKVVFSLLVLITIIGSLKYISFKQKERLYNTYTTVIIDGVSIKMNQAELLDYYRGK